MKKEIIILMLIIVSLVITGFILTGWKIGLGVTLLMWANNFSYKRESLAEMLGNKDNKK